MRTAWIDIAKGIGIILVVIGHSRAIQLGDGYVGAWITSFHMPLFFVLAGICFDENKYASCRAYLKRKLAALGWPYFMLSIFMSILSAFLYFGNEPSMRITAQLIGLSHFAPSISTFWFLPVLFMSELIYYAIARISTSQSIRLSICAVLAAVGAFAGLPPYPIPNTALASNALLVAMIYYAVGHCLRKCALKKQESHKSVLLVAVGALAVHAILVHVCFRYEVGFYSAKLGNPCLFFPVSAIAILGVSAISVLVERWKVISDLLSWCGRNSIIIMAVHGHCGRFRMSWGEAFGIGGASARVAEYCLMVALTVLLGTKLRFVAFFPRKAK